MSNEARFSRMMLSVKMEEAYEWRKWMGEIPYINFPENFLVLIVPPFGSAVVRFWVRDKNIPDSHVSVYLDCYDELGYMGRPYWEIYPFKDGEPERYLMNDVDGLIEGLKAALKPSSRR